MTNKKKDTVMTGLLETIIVMVLLLWLLGWQGVHLGGDLIHLLLVVVVVCVILRIVQGRRVL